jgi:hypothetical protein
MLKDKMVLLIVVNDEKKSIARLFLLGVSLNGEILSNRPSIVEENNNIKASYYLSPSPDSSMIGLCLFIPKQKHVDNNRIKAKIFSSELKELTSREVFFSTAENDVYKRIYVENALIDNAGDFYILGSKFSKGVNEYCSVWYLAKNANHPDPINNSLTYKKPKEYQLIMDNHGEPVLIGLYAEPDETKHYYTGYFYGKIRGVGLSIDMKTFLLPREIQHPPYSPDSFFPQLRTINKKDEGHILILEYAWIKSNNPHFGSLIVINLDKEGSLIYSSNVYKNQSKYLGAFREKSFLNYYSYLSIYDDMQGKLNILFNDNPKNSELTTEPTGTVLLNIENSSLASVQIDNKGKVLKKIISPPENNEIKLCTDILIKFTEDEFIIGGLKKDEFWLGRLLMN